MKVTWVAQVATARENVVCYTRYLSVVRLHDSVPLNCALIPFRYATKSVEYPPCIMS